MAELQILVVLVVLGALFFDFANGWNDSANAIATVVSTRVLSPLKAVLLAGVLNFAGALWGQAVAKTIMKGIIDLDALPSFAMASGSPEVIGLLLTLSAVLSAASWIWIATRFGLPISGSHSIVGAMVGAGLAIGGIGALESSGLIKVGLGLMFSPVLGLGLGFILMILIQWIFQKVPSGFVHKMFGKLQLVSVSFMAFSHGTNDAQKAMGVITMALIVGGFYSGDTSPLWVVFLCAVTMGLGTALGGWRVIRTLGMGLMHIRPVHGFAAETAASGVLITAATFGIPVSTTHVITSSIIGVGTTQGAKAVQWGIGKKIVTVWIVTFPATIMMGFLYFKLFKFAYSMF